VADIIESRAKLGSDVSGVAGLGQTEEVFTRSNGM